MSISLEPGGEVDQPRALRDGDVDELLSGRPGSQELLQSIAGRQSHRDLILARLYVFGAFFEKRRETKTKRRLDHTGALQDLPDLVGSCTLGDDDLDPSSRMAVAPQANGSEIDVDPDDRDCDRCKKDRQRDDKTAPAGERHYGRPRESR
jgi:hypothetical protein